MNKPIYYVVNGITLYRLLAAPVLLFFVFTRQLDVFKWLLAASFFTDAIDGYMARRFRVTSEQGSKIDSIADDLTVVAAIAGLFVMRPGFIREQWPVIIPLAVLYGIQLTLALVRYGKISSFHTYLAKGAAVLQGVFLVLAFFTEPIVPLFYAVALLTAIDLLEEVVLVVLLPRWQVNVKGLYWVWKKKVAGSFG
jgi:CDP-diacylglycerol--glycerol-3-phosphate 3-phosphatidyltransferase